MLEEATDRVVGNARVERAVGAGEDVYEVQKENPQRLLRVFNKLALPVAQLSLS